MQTRLSFHLNWFLLTILFICLAYLSFELIYIPFWTQDADEFVFAKHIYQYTFQLPYRDFPPYKTTLGYYLLSLPYFFTDALLKPLYYIKNEIALINTFCLFVSAIWASRFFDKRAVLAALLAVLANHFTLLYSADLRVDMLTVWACLFACLAMLDRRMLLAGTCIGIAFLISQKAIWYLTALNAGMLFCLLMQTKAYRLIDIIKFNLAALASILIYIILWSLVSSPAAVIHSLFYEAYIQAGIGWYKTIYFTSWHIILHSGPILFLLWPLCAFSLKQPPLSSQRLLIIGSSSVFLLCFIYYKQPFAYNFVFALPAFFLLYAEMGNWLLSSKPHNKLNLFYLSLLVIYTIAIFLILYLFHLNVIFYFAVSLPMLLYLFINHHRFYHAAGFSILAVFCVTAIAFPAWHSYMVSRHFDGSYQKTMIQTANTLLAEKGVNYIAGIPFIYNKDQGVDGLQNLISPAIDYLYHPRDSLKPLMLDSLGLSTLEIEDIRYDFEAKPVKLIINNYRMMSLPPMLRNYIHANYQQFYGSIYLYAPEVLSSQISFHLKFGGRYRIKSDARHTILLDKKHFHNNEIIKLKKGDHLTKSKTNYRLILVPDNAVKLDPRYREDKWKKMIKSVNLL